MEQNNDTRVIYFSDLLFSVLYAWRSIVVIALALALLLGGLQSVRYLKAHSAGSDLPSEKVLQKIAEQEEKLEVNQIRIASLEDYLSKSVLMNINPYQIYQASANIYIEAQTPELTVAAVRAYLSSMRSCVAVSNIAQTLDVSPEYLMELVSCQMAEDSDNLISVVVNYSDAEGAEQFLSVLLAGAEDATEQITQDIAAHTIRIITYPTIQKPIPNLQKQQEEYAASLDTLKTEQATIESTLQKLHEHADGQMPSNPVTVALIGAVIGAGITICFVLVNTLVTDKIYSARTLKNRICIKVLGCIPNGKKQCKFDLMLRKLEKRAWHPDQIAIATTTVIHHCQEAKHLLIVGNYDSAVLDTFREALTQKGIAVTDGQNILYNAAGVRALPDCDAVLFLETCKKSLYSEVDKAMEIVADHNKRLLGCILLGG